MYLECQHGHREHHRGQEQNLSQSVDLQVNQTHLYRETVAPLTKSGVKDGPSTVAWELRAAHAMSQRQLTYVGETTNP